MDKSSAKILVLGDSGVGKSSLVHLICHSTVLSSAQCTIGCSIDVKLHDNYFLEFWDIGGSRSHKIARSFLYQDYHGIILVFDATNNKSRENLKEWLMEAFVKVPTLTIATRTDLLSKKFHDDFFSIVKFDENEVIYVNTQDPTSFRADTKNYERLNNFFKNVINRRNNRFAI